MASDVSDGSVGRRIAKYRKLRGLTQRGLAMRANVAYGTLTKIESGHALAPPAVIAALARALSVNVADLTGQPFMDELRQERVDRLIEPLRLALDRFDLPPPEDVEPRSTAEVDRATTDLCDQAIRVATLIEGGHYGRAIEASAALHVPRDWPATRAAHHYMDLGRAYAALNRHERALNALNEARQLAPQQTRFHPTTRQAVEHLLAMRRSVPEPLARYARWVGL